MVSAWHRLRAASFTRLRFAVLAALTANLFLAPYRSLRDAIDTDYVVYVTGARALAQGLCLYCDDVQTRIQSQFLGFSVAGIYHDHYVHPPLDAFLFLPLAWLPLQAGLAIWLVVDMAFLLAAAFFLWRLCQGLEPRFRLSVLVLAVASLPAALMLALGQLDILALLALAAGTWFLRRHLPYWGGLVMAVALVKPQAMWLLPLFLLAKGKWQALLGFITGSLLFTLASLLLAGAAIGKWPNELALNLQYGHGLGEFARHAFGGTGMWITCAAIAVAGLALYLQLSRSEDDPLPLIGAAVASSLVASPFLHAYDPGVAAISLVALAKKSPLLVWPLGLAVSGAMLLESWLAGSEPITLAVLALIVIGCSKSFSRIPWAVRPAAKPAAAAVAD